MAVRIDIRPRLTLREEPQAKPRRRARLPPLTLPSLAYWAAMGALTYFFAHLEPPLEPTAAPEASSQSESMPRGAVQPAIPTPPPMVEDSNRAPEPEPPSAPVSAAKGTLAAEPSASAPAPETAPLADAPSAELSEDARLSVALPSPQAIDFPRFTDSSRPGPRPRGADGPRINDLFEHGAERAEADRPNVVSPDTSPDRTSIASSCEAAIARNNEQITVGGPRGPADVTRDQYANVLQNGRYLSACNIPPQTVFEVCAAVRNGRAVGITVTSNPASPSLNACVRRAVSALEFPANPRLDVTHTRFEAERR